MKNCRFFNRYSFNIFTLSAPITLISAYLANLLVGLVLFLRGELDYGAGALGFVSFIVTFSVFQYITLLITLWLIIKEQNQEFRIKNNKILTIINTPLYKIAVCIMFVCSIFFQTLGFKLFEILKTL